GPRPRRRGRHPAPGAHPGDRRRAHPQAVLPDRRRPLLETTLARIAPLVPPERTLAIVNRGHLRLARPRLAAIPSGYRARVARESSGRSPRCTSVPPWRAPLSATAWARRAGTRAR